jgi:hypothetical protein
MNWLAAPEPVSAAAKARPKAKSPSPQVPAEETSEASLPATTLDTTAAVEPSSSAEAGNTASSSTERPALPAETGVATADPGTRPESVSPSPEQEKVRMAHAEVSSDEARPMEETAARVPNAVSASATATASSTSDNNARPAKRPHRRQASNRPEKRKLVLMTLRTIQYADGRQATQLVPYRGRERVLAFGTDE